MEHTIPASASAALATHTMPDGRAWPRFTIVTPSYGRFLALAAGVFAAEGAADELDHVTRDVISKTKAPEPEPVLSVTGAHAPELEERVPSADVVRVGLEDFDSLGIPPRELLRMLISQATGEPIELPRDPSRKAPRHALRRVTFPRFSPRA